MSKALFIGRWQPFHKGHEWLIDQALDKGKEVLVAVRDIPPDPSNPFTTEATMTMIREVYKDRPVEVMKIPDIESVNYGRGVGYAIVEHTPPKDISRISATEIRGAILSGDNSWREEIDHSIQDMVELNI